MRRQAGAEAAGPFDRPDPAPSGLLACEAQQLGIAGAIGGHRQVSDQPPGRGDECGRMRVLMGIDSDDKVDVLGE